ncbi:uncharacterized protein LOC144138960 [Haemaphysalis longicornis]
MAYVPPSEEQTTLRVDIDGVPTDVYLRFDTDGLPMQDGSGYVYETIVGRHVTLRFTAGGGENSPPPAQPPTSSASDGNISAAALADEPELWSARRTKFFLAQYSELKDLVGKSRTLRTRKQLWLKLAELINAEFSCTMTATQVENKWKSLERSYEKIKKNNNSSGRPPASCEHEEELAAILDKQHNINPRILLEPGKAILPGGNPGASTAATELADDLPVPVERSGEGPPGDVPVQSEGGPAPKRMRRSRSQLSPLLETLQLMGEARAKHQEARAKAFEARQKWEEAKAKRHEERMERFDRLLDLLANKGAAENAE